jgi:hypothetical protein
MAYLTAHKKLAIRKHEVVYQCLLEDLVEQGVLEAAVADELLKNTAGHPRPAPVAAPVPVSVEKED